MIVIKGRRLTIECVVDHVTAEAARLGLRVSRIVGRKSPDGMVEFSAVLS
jgi:hypothetical protein